MTYVFCGNAPSRYKYLLVSSERKTKAIHDHTGSHFPL